MAYKSPSRMDGIEYDDYMRGSRIWILYTTSYPQPDRHDTSSYTQGYYQARFEETGELPPPDYRSPEQKLIGGLRSAPAKEAPQPIVRKPTDLNAMQTIRMRGAQEAVFGIKSDNVEFGLDTCSISRRNGEGVEISKIFLRVLPPKGFEATDTQMAELAVRVATIKGSDTVAVQTREIDRYAVGRPGEPRNGKRPNLAFLAADQIMKGPARRRSYGRPHYRGPGGKY